MAASIEKIRSEIEDEWADTAPYTIVCYPADYTLEVLYQKDTNDDLIVVDFQRQFVWTLSQASRLIESFLLGLPVPGIFLYKEHKTGELVVIDGLQRLTTVFSFFKGTFPTTERAFRLSGLRDRWEGKLFAELSEADKRRLQDSVLRATIVNQIDPGDNSSIFEIFHRLNTGGTTLTPQEIRNCIFRGPLNNALKRMNELQAWRDIFGPRKADKRMRDVELIARFFALREDAVHYRKPMKDFISKYMEKHKQDTEDRIASCDRVFEATVTRIVEALSQRPFNLKAGINVATCDAVMVAISEHLDQELPPDLARRYQRLVRNERFLECVSAGTTDVEIVRERLSLAREILFGA